MKKFFSVIAAAFVAMSVNAQVYVGGSLGFASYDNGESSTSFKFMPHVGYSIDENIGVGISLGYSQGDVASSLNLAGNNEDFKTFSVAPYLRYSFAKMGPVKLFADARLEYAHGENKVGGHKIESNGLGLGILPGLAVSLTDKLSFVSHFAFLGYNQVKPKDGDTTSAFGLNVDNGLSFGVFYNF